MPRKMATFQVPPNAPNANHHVAGQPAAAMPAAIPPAGAIPPAPIPAEESWGQLLLRPLRYCWDHPALAVTLLLNVSVVALAWVQTSHSVPPRTEPFRFSKDMFNQPNPASLQNDIPGWKPTDQVSWTVVPPETRGALNADWKAAKQPPRFQFSWEKTQQYVREREERDARARFRKEKRSQPL